MKLNTKHSLKNVWAKVVLGIGIATLPFAACDKTKDDNGTKPIQPAKKVYTFVYNTSGIPDDTARAYMTYDTFYVVPFEKTLFQTSSEAGIHKARNHLESRVAINPKTRGKDLFYAAYASDEDSAWLANFGYEVRRR